MILSVILSNVSFNEINPPGIFVFKRNWFLSDVFMFFDRIPIIVLFRFSFNSKDFMKLNHWFVGRMLSIQIKHIESGLFSRMAFALLGS